MSIFQSDLDKPPSYIEASQNCQPPPPYHTDMLKKMFLSQAKSASKYFVKTRLVSMRSFSLNFSRGPQSKRDFAVHGQDASNKKQIFASEHVNKNQALDSPGDLKETKHFKLRRFFSNPLS